MKRDSFISAIDIGSHKIRVMVAETLSSEEDGLRVIGVSEVDSLGFRKGVVSDGESLAKSLSKAIEEVENMADVRIKEAAVSLGGTNIKTLTNKGVVAVSEVNGEVSLSDVSRAITSAGNIDIPLNYEVMQIIPRSYRLDDQSDIIDPIGMKGVRLEVDALVILGFSPQIKHLQSVLSACDVSVSQFVFSPLAAAEAVLDREQKELGVAVVDMGTLSTGVVVYEEGYLLHCDSVPMGSGHVTNDIATGLRINVAVAEKVKLQLGCGNMDSFDKTKDVQLEAIDPSEEGEVSLYHIGEIIEARLEEIFEKTREEFVGIERDNLLPAGVVLVGGGSAMPELIDLAKRTLNLSVAIGYPRNLNGLIEKADDPSYAVVSGLIYWQIHSGYYQKEGGAFSLSSLPLWEKIRGWFRMFMP
jgi:cell division protein FtsA